MAEIKFRKKKLKDDIDKLESSFKDRADKVRSIIPVNVNPRVSIRKHPFRALSIAVASGLVIGFISRKKRSRSVNEGSYSSSNNDSGFTSLLMYEMKRLAAHRAVSYISNMIDQRASG